MAIPIIINQPQPGIVPNVEKNQSTPPIMKITAKDNKNVNIFSVVSDIFFLRFVNPPIRI